MLLLLLLLLLCLLLHQRQRQRLRLLLRQLLLPFILPRFPHLLLLLRPHLLELTRPPDSVFILTQRMATPMAHACCLCR